MTYMQKILSLTFFSQIVLAFPLLANQGGFRVNRFFGTGPDANLIVLEAGKMDGVVVGDVFRIFRNSQQSTRDTGLTIETGEAKAISVYEDKTIAEVTIQSTPLSVKVFPKFAEVMAGDFAVKQRIEIKRSLSLSPEVNLAYSKIFEDPNPVPQSFELSSLGREFINQEIVDLAKVKTGLLMVIGHTDSSGPAEANQIESYQRAVVVRQYLIDTLGFDADRVVALGKGEDELPEEPLTPNYKQRARRIVVKVVNNPQS
ncbi:MAG: OmpA family protein [Proteobacteria bacterium]|nr:OmpA family protein [Pseudomonadota bacterium]